MSSSSNKKNNALALRKIKTTVDDILTELDAFSKNLSHMNALKGSAAVYLLVYSLYLDEKNKDKKEDILALLKSLPTPNDMDVILRKPLINEDLDRNNGTYTRANGKPLTAMTEADGIKIKRGSDTIYEIDLIIDNKNIKEADFVDIKIRDKNISILHPRKIKGEYNDNNTARNKKELNRLTKISVLEQLIALGLIPKQEIVKKLSTFSRIKMRSLSSNSENNESPTKKYKKQNSIKEPLAMALNLSSNSASSNRENSARKRKSLQTKKKKDSLAKSLFD